VALGAAEIGLRVTGWEPPARRSKRSLLDRSPNHRAWYDCYTSNPNGEFRSLPDVTVGSWLLVDNLLPPMPVPFEKLRETPWCVEYELSSQGLRDRERAADAVPGALRVAIVGDSFVFGEGVPVEKSLPAEMQRELGPSMEILNLGWPGDDTKRELARLSAAITSFRLRRAVVVFIANDVPMTPELQREQDYIHDLVQYRDAYEARSRGGSGRILGSRLLYLLGVRFDMRRVTSKTIRWYRDLYDPARNASGLRDLQASFAELAKLRDCRVVLALYPLLEGFEDGYPLQSVHDSVGAMARAAGLAVIDLAPAFAGRRTESLWVHPSDHHPNGSAHAIAARALVEGLRSTKNGFLAP
jgi:hypothetical protein